MKFLKFDSVLPPVYMKVGGPQVGEVTCGGLPHLTCKRDHIKMRDNMDSRVTPPKRVTSPIWGTRPSCKHLGLKHEHVTDFSGRERLLSSWIINEFLNSR